MGIVRRFCVAAVVVGAMVLPMAVAPAPAGAVLTVPPMTSVASGLRHTCGISAGAVWCWGTNANSILGNPAVTAAWYPLAVDVAGTPLDGKTVKRIEADTWATCALTSEGQLSCWGRNYLGVNGTGDLAEAPKPRAVVTAGTPLEGTTVVDYAVGVRSACALTATNVIACWGDNSEGFLGVGDSSVHRVPTPVVVAGTVLAGKTIVDISVEGSHACAVTSDGIGACWGSGQYGRLGTGTTANAPSPVPIATTGTILEGKVITQIVTGTDSSCALASDSTIACWGGGSGRPSTATEIVRTGTPLAGKVIAELTRGGGNPCARTTDGKIACWGSNGDEQLGVPNGSYLTTPVAPQTAGTNFAGKTISRIDAGSKHTCAVATDGVVGCWGDNTYGQLGRSTNGGGFVPGAIRYGAPSGATDVTAVPGPRQITVSWKPPASSGGYPVTGYSVVLTWPLLGIRLVSIADPATRSVVVPTLLNGVEYSVTVAAKNETGTGVASTPVVRATPQALPSTFAPEASWAAWTARQHQDVLGRAPTAAETSAWVSRLTATPTDKGVLVETLRRSAENTSAVDPAVRLYRAFLGRSPDVSGLEFWIQRRRSGSWTLVRMADQFASSSEFTRKYGTLTNEQFVTRIYTDVLGRDADPTGVAYWTGRLDAKARTRGSVMVGFSESSEYQRKQADNTDLAVAYAFLLGRQPTSTEVTNWIASRAGSVTHAVLLRELLDSVEYTTG